jgi:TolA-binding protein
MNLENCLPLPPMLSSAPPDGVDAWAELVRQQQTTIQAQQESIEFLERQLRQQQDRIEQLGKYTRMNSSLSSRSLKWAL